MSYTYDTLGKLISIKDQNGNDITNNTSSVGYKNPYRYRGYRYDTETGMYYLQSRYYNPELGRFLNADAIAAVTGDLLSSNMFIYSKNNAVTMSDPSGFRPIYTVGKESDEMREASLVVMNKAAVNKHSTTSKKSSSKSKGYDYTGSIIGPALSTAVAATAEKTLGQVIAKTKYYGNLPIPVKLSDCESFGTFTYAFAGVSLYFSVKDNFSGKYSKNEAWIRTGIDVACTVGVLVFCASGGWAAVGVGLGIGLLEEGGKLLVHSKFKKEDYAN